jgi:hypothetical protein
MEENEKTLIKDEWELNPRCISGTRCFAYVNTGHMTPCCWVDGDDIQQSDEYKQFFTDEMKLTNFNSVQDIFDTDVWIDFFEMLLDRPKEAPWICWKYCGEFNHTPGQRTPNRDIYRSAEYESLQERYKDNSVTKIVVTPKCIDGIRASFIPLKNLEIDK